MNTALTNEQMEGSKMIDKVCTRVFTSSDRPDCIAVGCVGDDVGEFVIPRGVGSFAKIR